MIEDCKLCKEDVTPWQYVPDLDGHVCQLCAEYLSAYQRKFYDYVDNLNLLDDFFDTGGYGIGCCDDLDYKKRITKLLVDRWGK